MSTRFLHCADIHLGYQQYGQKQRFNDFGRALHAIVDKATGVKTEFDPHITGKVDFVILAGDLFHKRSIDALTLNQAVRALQRLRDANIPCIAVEGNHERSYYEETIGWMKFLALQDLLILLDAEFVDGKPQLRPWGANRQGSYIDLPGGIRVHGLRYYGSGTALAVDAYAQALSELDRTGVDYSIFIAHAGVEGQMDDKAGGLSYGQWAPLRPHVDYLALGHFHKPFQLDDWIYNPGSPENCSVAEASWRKRGYLIVEPNTVQPSERSEPVGPRHSITLGANPRRACRLYPFDCGAYGTPEALLEGLSEFLVRQAAELNAKVDKRETREFMPAIIELYLTGMLAFDRSALDLHAVEEAVKSAFSPLVVIVKNLTQSTAYEVDVDMTKSRAELEHSVLSGIFARDSRYAENSDDWAHLAIELKQLALSGASPDAIVDTMAARAAQISSGSHMAPEGASAGETQL